MSPSQKRVRALLVACLSSSASCLSHELIAPTLDEQRAVLRPTLGCFVGAADSGRYRVWIAEAPAVEADPCLLGFRLSSTGGGWLARTSRAGCPLTIARFDQYGAPLRVVVIDRTLATQREFAATFVSGQIMEVGSGDAFGSLPHAPQLFASSAAEFSIEATASASAQSPTYRWSGWPRIVLRERRSDGALIRIEPDGAATLVPASSAECDR